MLGMGPTTSGLFITLGFGTGGVTPTPSPTSVPGGSSKRDKKRKRVIHFSDLDERERIEALAQIPVKPFEPIEQAAVNLSEARGEEETEDDEDELTSMIILRMYH